MSVLTLDQIVSSYLSQFERPQSEYRRIYDIALRGFRFMELHSTGVPLTVELDVAANKTATLPATVLSVLEVGYQDSDGIIIPLTENKNMTLLNSTSATRATGIPADSATTVQLYPEDSRLQLGNSYKVDYEHSVIILDYDFSETTIIVKALEMFAEQSEEYAVNQFFEESLLAFISWHDSKRAKNTQADRQLNRQDFFNELSNARKAINGLSLMEIYTSYRREQSLGKNKI